MVPQSREAWLFAGTTQSGPPDGSNVGELIKAYRNAHHLTQAQMAAKLGFDASYISMIETGKRAMRDVGHLRQVAEFLDIPEEEFGLLPAPHEPVQLSTADTHAVARAVEVATLDELARDPASESQRDWRRIRRLLNQNRNGLSHAAQRLYPDNQRIRGVISQPGWFGGVPIPLDDIELTWLGRLNAPRIIGAEPQSDETRPLLPNGSRFERYTRAIKAIERPTLFENRMSFRLASVEWNDHGARLGFGYTTYFDMVDVCEAVAHEFAAAWRAFGASREWLERPNWLRLPLRSMIGDPFDLGARAVLPSVDTLTIRRPRSGAPSFLLHRRDATNVAIGGGYYHIMPAGVFQPSTLAPWDQSNDFDLWRNAMREYSEEFLGMAEADGSSGEPIDYTNTEPFRTMNAARDTGAFRMFGFGITLDPLTLAGEILTVSVVDEEAYDEIFAGLVAANSEGSIVAASPVLSEGIAFTQENVRRILDSEPIAPAAAACLDLAWQHRDRLID
jgi:transcriptional regulator with XRE-family HTH domain